MLFHAEVALNLDVCYAHSLEDQPESSWQELEVHLLAVAARAAAFSESFASKEWGYCSGLWHDLGKYQPEFQARLRGEKKSVEHSGLGAALAFQKDKERGLPLAFVIAGHHSGLANFVESGPGLPTSLKERLSKNALLLQRTQPELPVKIAERRLPDLPEFLGAVSGGGLRHNAAQKRRAEFWLRFVFSALIDADRLDTEAFCQPEKRRFRGAYSDISSLHERLNVFIAAKLRGLTEETRTNKVNVARGEVLDACRKNATAAQGVFTLTVPTGGGKTLSAMAFGLHHAEYHQLRRVIVVIPYTSIIEQNAIEYRKAVGEENVVEHQSNLDPHDDIDKRGVELTRKEELACENWDAPVIVTTTVQFFESLFSNATSRCRKLHNIARSVIILDEVQTLPPGFLLSIMDGLNELVQNYGCSIVLSTATPPALAKRERFECGLALSWEIVPNTKSLALDLERVHYRWPAPAEQALAPALLAEKLSNHLQVLAIVHRREDARIVAMHMQSLVKDGSVRHLSALMCPAHRSSVLKNIKDKLKEGEPCRVVSTQLVEAGVDVDFPVVYRAMAGLDSIVQAAGRRNREGRLDKGEIMIFRAQSAPPRGTPRRAMEITESLLREAEGSLDLSDPSIFETYFRMLYFGENLDSRQIQTLREGFNFATVGREFKLIEDGFTHTIIVPYGDANERLDTLRNLGPNRATLRGLQAFTVSIYSDAFARLSKAGALDEVSEGIFTLTAFFQQLYSQEYGLVVGDEPSPDVQAMIV
jgi:CRISPR-associated endonuclease/helicase Cas3